MAVSSSSIPKVKLSQLDGTRYPQRLGDAEAQTLKAALYGTNVDDNFDSPLSWSMVNSDPAGVGALLDSGTAPAAGVERAFSSRKARYEQHITAINGTAVWSTPASVATGLALYTDADATNGILAYEITNGCLTNSSVARTVGTDKDAFFEVAFTVADISDLTELWVGWRKAEPYQVDADDYDECAAFNVGAGADGRINTATILNNAATTVTNTGVTALADSGSATLKVIVRQNRTVEFWVNGTQYNAGFQFDSGEIVVPFLQITAETGDPGIILQSWRCGWC